MTDLGTDPSPQSLHEAVDLVRAGVLAPADVLDSCLRRVDAFEPRLRAWAHLDPDDARSHVAAGDGHRAVGEGSLQAAPIGVKDNIDTIGIPTSAGSRLLAENVPDQDAVAVRRLRQAGAIVLGKTMSTELATNDPAPTRNPWRLAHTPGGSSAGSGVAVATGMCLATVDTQTAGDILRPAAYTGVVGFKPSYGRISRRGTVPVAWSIDTIGVQAKTVRDVALLFSVLAGHDPGDPTSAPNEVPDISGDLAEPSQPPRVGVIRDYFYQQADDEVREHTDAVLAALARAGAYVVEIHPDVDFSLLHAAHRAVTFVECAALHEELYRRHANQMGEKLRTLIELGLVTPGVAYVQAQRVRASLGRSLRQVHDGLDVVLTPPAPGPAPDDPTTTGSSVLQIPWTFCGLPTVSIPTGLSGTGLPLGIQLVGALFDERRLLAAAEWCRQSLDIRLPAPSLLTTGEGVG